MIYAIGVIGSLALVAATLIPFLAPRRRAGKHRGTYAQLREQEAAFRLRSYSYAMERRRAELIEYGARADWKLS